MMNWKLIVMGLAALTVAGCIVAGYMFIQGLVADLSDAQKRLGTMETAIEVQDDTIEAQRDALKEWQEAQAAMQAQLEELNDVTLEAQANTRELRRFFASADLSTMDPVALDALVNHAADRSDCLLSKATGASGLDCSRGD